MEVVKSNTFKLIPVFSTLDKSVYVLCAILLQECSSVQRNR